jgi:predicted MFS family arabinose efflux permease
MSQRAARDPRALAVAATLIALTSNSTASSAIFVAYRQQWGLSPGDIGLVFSAYVGALVPVLLAFGGVAERYGRRQIVATGFALMLAGTLVLICAHGFQELLFARFLQGAGAALAVGVISATFTETYRGKIAAGQALAVVTAAALSFGPVVTAIAYDLGGGTNLSYIPMFTIGIASCVLLGFFDARPNGKSATDRAEEPLPPSVVSRALRLAMPMVFVAWAGSSLYLSLVPAYLATILHARDPLIGAGAFVGTQIASVMASILYGRAKPERSGIIAPFGVVAGLSILILGTQAHLWWMIALGTVAVGTGSGVASGAAFTITGQVGRGQRPRVFSRLLVAAYLGYSLPTLLVALIASKLSFTTGFAITTSALMLIAIALPFLRSQPQVVAASQTSDPSQSATSLSELIPFECRGSAEKRVRESGIHDSDTSQSDVVIR